MLGVVVDDMYHRCELAISRRASVERLLHAGLYYGAATREAPGVRGKDIFVIGGGNSAGQATMNFADGARSVTLVVRAERLAASMSSYSESPNRCDA